MRRLGPKAAHVDIHTSVEGVLVMAHTQGGRRHSHWAGHMLCYSNRIKQGFRLAQTLVYTVLITQHIACYPERQDTRAIREYRAPEVKDVHDTLHHNLRGPPHPEGGGGRPTKTARRAGKGTKGTVRRTVQSWLPRAKVESSVEDTNRSRS